MEPLTNYTVWMTWVAERKRTRATYLAARRRHARCGLPGTLRAMERAEVADLKTKQKVAAWAKMANEKKPAEAG